MDYGTRNIAYVGGWRALENDGPMWALNLMRYRSRAIYADGRETTLTGMEADDLYAPHEALAEIGGRSVIRARVARVSGQFNSEPSPAVIEAFDPAFRARPSGRGQ